MAITQLSVYLENKPGTLSDAITQISDAGVNIRALSLADTADFGILRLIVSDIEKTKKVLEGHVIALETPVIAIRMNDEAGALKNILNILSSSGISIEYLYAFTASTVGSACVVFRVNDAAAAELILKNHGEKTLSDEELKELL